MSSVENDIVLDVIRRHQREDWDAVNALVSRYVSEYELRADQDHKPNEREQLMIVDAITGLLSEEEFCQLMGRIYARSSLLRDPIARAVIPEKRDV